MSWSFSTDPELKVKLDWARDFVDQRVLPLEILADRWAGPDGRRRYLEHVRPLKAEVVSSGLWAAHLPVDLGGTGMGQVQLALLHEILGRTPLAPPIFGNQAPDSGNAEIIARYGTDDIKARWLGPLLAGEISSCFAMTEHGGGSDPASIKTSARVERDEWVIDGAKWFISNASHSHFHIVMCRTGEKTARNAFTMIIVPSDTPGAQIVRDIATMGDPQLTHSWLGSHAEVSYENVRVPLSNTLGATGDGLRLAQARLGPGRIHHAMRWLGQSQRAFDMLCERAVSRSVFGSTLAEKQTVQSWIADSYAAMQAARLLTLQAAWRMDQLHQAGKSYAEAKLDISLVKFWGAPVMLEVIDRAMQVHGALGYSGDLPLESMYRRGRAARLVDGPDEIHKARAAREILRGYRPRPEPSEHVSSRRSKADGRYFNPFSEGYK